VAEFMRVEDLQVYQKLCQLHIEVCDLSWTWPANEKYELGSQVRRSSNSPPANLAEKHSDRHVKNKIEGANRARGEALETVHHLYVLTSSNTSRWRRVKDFVTDTWNASEC
jgi:four helix bundle protein